jgi:hypothetical protein
MLRTQVGGSDPEQQTGRIEIGAKRNTDSNANKYQIRRNESDDSRVNMFTHFVTRECRLVERRGCGGVVKKPHISLLANRGHRM